MQFEALVFDFDGVLVDSVDVKTRAFAELYAEHGPDVVAKVVAYHLAHGGVSRFEKFRHYHRAFLGQALSAEREERLAKRFSELVENAVVEAPWIAGAREFLEAYYRRLPLFVASGTPEDELKRIVERRGAQHYFAGIHGAPLTKGRIITAIVRGRGLRPERVLMLGDSDTDFEGAREAGVNFIGIVATGGRLFPGAVAVVPDLTELNEFLTEHARL